MEKDILLKLEKDYYDAITTRDKDEIHIDFLQNVQHILDKFPFVKKYINFEERINNFYGNYSNNNDLLDQLIDDYNRLHLLDKNNEIYFYLGAYAEIDGVTWMIPRDKDTAEYDLYMNIESEELIKNPVAARKEFEDNHKVIFFLRQIPSDRDYRDVHLDFFRTCIIEGQDSACEKVLNRKF